MINRLFLSDETWCIDDSKLQEEAIQFYKNLFCSEVTVTTHFMESVSLLKLSPQGISNLEKPISIEDVYAASFKSPGKDDLQTFFLKKYWNVVRDDIQHLVQAAFINGCFDKDLTDTLIVLIPKEERPQV